MNVIVGNKSELALEVIYAEQEPSEGTIYMYVNGQKFGYERHEYEIAPAIKNVVQYFSVPEHDYKNLIVCPLPILFSAFDIAYEEDLENDDPGFIEELNKHSVNEYYSGFFSDFINSSKLDDCMFRQGNYMFDDATCLVVPKGEAIRICVRNDLTGDSAEVVSTSNDFIGLWGELEGCVE